MRALQENETRFVIDVYLLCGVTIEDPSDLTVLHSLNATAAWDQLAKEFEGNPNVAIVDVDCTADNAKDTCSKYGVRGYPTIKYFTDSTDPMGDAYEGGRTFDDLKKFADENLGPSCGPDNLDLCDDEAKAEIEKYQGMDVSELEAKIKESDDAVSAAEKTFKDEVSKLQSKYEQLMKEKDDAIEAAKNPSLKYMRSVVNAAKKSGKDEL